MGIWWTAKVIISFNEKKISKDRITNRLWIIASWLLRDPQMKVRTSYPGFTQVADGYLTEVFRRVVDLQFQRGDGPIIAYQVRSILSPGGMCRKNYITDFLYHDRWRMSTEHSGWAMSHVTHNI